MRKTALCALVALFVTSAASAATPEFLSQHETKPEDIAAIQTLLTAYTTAVTKHDQAGFEKLLLDDQVPFSSTYSLVGPKADQQHVDTHRYAEFRQSIFADGAHYAQQFYNVHIEQDGPLAQVSLDFITKDAETGRGGYGFKTLQLLKVQGQWKIASEFYTGRALPNAS